MKLFSLLESELAFCVTLLNCLLEVIAVFCILLEILRTGQLTINFNRHHRPNSFFAIRLEFGMWLVMALEFQLGADIVSTTLSSTFDSLTKLAIVALIRTFLNYFLTQELDYQKKSQDQ